VAPSPPKVLAAVHRFLDTSGFPEVLSGIDPSFSPPVQAPDPASLEAGVRLAAKSTVKIKGQACSAIQEGSGVVAGPGLVVTNAHVVAGVKSPRVQLPDGKSNLSAQAVVFDPDRDLAVLEVRDLGAPSLELIEHKAPRGTPGAVLGYPGDGPFQDEPAAIRAELSAVGRDIYYDHRVERNIYVIQASVRPGNSGGPLVGTDGRVLGVVFAAAVGESNTGYALTNDEVRPVLDQAQAAAGPVTTGDCRS
jgi:S1-C subfamily serine protease